MGRARADRAFRSLLSLSMAVMGNGWVQEGTARGGDTSMAGGEWTAGDSGGQGSLRWSTSFHESLFVGWQGRSRMIPFGLPRDSRIIGLSEERQALKPIMTGKHKRHVKLSRCAS